MVTAVIKFMSLSEYHAFIGGYIQNAEVCKESGFNAAIGKLL